MSDDSTDTPNDTWSQKSTQVASDVEEDPWSQCSTQPLVWMFDSQETTTSEATTMAIPPGITQEDDPFTDDELESLPRPSL